MVHTSNYVSQMSCCLHWIFFLKLSEMANITARYCHYFRHKQVAITREIRCEKNPVCFPWWPIRPDICWLIDGPINKVGMYGLVDIRHRRYPTGLKYRPKTIYPNKIRRWNNYPLSERFDKNLKELQLEAMCVCVWI